MPADVTWHSYRARQPQSPPGRASNASASIAPPEQFHQNSQIPIPASHCTPVRSCLGGLRTPALMPHARPMPAVRKPFTGAVATSQAKGSRKLTFVAAGRGLPGAQIASCAILWSPKWTPVRGDAHRFSLVNSACSYEKCGLIGANDVDVVSKSNWQEEHACRR